MREAGRWLSDSSLRIYLDLVGAASLAQQHKLQGREHELVYAASYFLEYLPGASAFQRSEDYGSFSDPFVRHPRDAEGPLAVADCRFLVIPIMASVMSRDCA